MNLFSIFHYGACTALVILSIYHLYRREYKIIASTGMVFALTFLPYILEKFCHIRLDLLGFILYIVILVMSIYLGNTIKFYDRYPWWDRVIHLLSGVVVVNFGVAAAKNVESLSRFHILVFSFSLSMAVHVIWEALEYIFDCIFHMDNQRWQKVNATNNHKPASAIQPAGLVDTMNDTLICIAGTAGSCIIWRFIL